MNYHVLKTDYKLRSANVIFHISIPDEDNSAGTSLRTALYQWLGNATVTSVVPNLATDDPTEYEELQTGSIYEYCKKVTFSSAGTIPPEKQDEIDAEYTSLSVSVVEHLRKILKYWGKKRNVT